MFSRIMVTAFTLVITNGISKSGRRSFRMKLHKTRFAVLAAALAFSGLALSQNEKPIANHDVSNSAEVKPFLGRWDLTLYAPDRQYPSWLELTENGGQLEGRMVGRWGNAHPILDVKAEKSVLTFSSSKDEEDTP